MKQKTKGERNARKLWEKIFGKKGEENSKDCVAILVRILWVLYYLVAVALTVLSALQLYDDYKVNPVQLRAAVQNDTIRIPDAVVCLKVKCDKTKRLPVL